MSDSNDKKPASSNPGWPKASDPTRESSVPGHSMDDPLAELDRIVNQNYGSGGTAGQQQGVVSDEDLRFLEQELIRELRGKQEADPAQAPQADPAPAPAAAQPATQPMADESDQLRRPHPLAPSAPEAPAAAARQPAAPQRSGPNLSAPNYPTERSAQPERPAAPEQRPEPRYAQPPVEEPAPRAAMPTSDSAARSNFAAPNLDDWSNLFAEDGPDTKYGEPAAQATPAAPAVTPRPAEPRYSDPAPAPSVEPGAAVSGSYGQLNRTPASGRDQQPADRIGSYRPGQSPAQAPTPTPQPTYESREEAPAAPAAPVAPRVASTWEEQIAEMPAASHQPAARSYQEPAQEYQAPSEPAAYAGYVPAQDPMATHGVPEVTAPVTSDPASDPYAAFNQQATQPEQAYDPSQGYAGAPSVDVTGHNQDYAATDPRYYDPQMYADPNAAQAYDPNYAAYDQAYQGEYAQGTYADPAVAQAAMEGSPYAPEDEYSAADVEAAAAASAAAAKNKRKSRKALVPILAAVGVVIVGGLVAWGFMGGDNGTTETPVITAETDPVKEAPEDPGGKIVPHQNKTVYNRIDGTETDEAPSSMMPATESPMALDTNGQSPRVIDMSSDKSNTATNNPGDPSSIAPKEVRTVIVRPDGTIVPQSTQTETANAPAVEENPLLQATPSESALQQTLDTNVNGTPNQADITTAAETAPLPRAKPAELVALQAAQSTQPSNQLTVPQPASNPVLPQATQTSPGPLVLSPSNTQTQTQVPQLPTPTPQVPINNASNGDYTVQVTSQRTPDQARASYASIQAQLPTVLGGYQPDIKEADLGDRGTYYRVRVGSFADRASATSFCSSIKAAGGDCLVARK